LKNTKNLDFWWNFKVLSLSRFGEILAVLGSFGQVWAEIAALTVAAQSMAEILKTP
jgi:hypothetical protein